MDEEWETTPRSLTDSWEFTPRAASAILQRSIDIRRADADVTVRPPSRSWLP
jgi:hypothetical protein